MAFAMGAIAVSDPEFTGGEGAGNIHDRGTYAVPVFCTHYDIAAILRHRLSGYVELLF